MNTTFGGDENMFARIVKYLEPGIELHHEDKIEDGDETQTNQAVKANFASSEVKAADWFEWPNLLPDG